MQYLQHERVDVFPHLNIYDLFGYEISFEILLDSIFINQSCALFICEFFIKFRRNETYLIVKVVLKLT